MPSETGLSLPAKLFLLAYDPDRRRMTRQSDHSYLLRAAALADLSQRRCVSDRDGRVRASGTRRTGDPVLDGLLRTVAESKPRSWRSWVRRGPRSTVGAVRDQLAAAGTITVTSSRFLGLIPLHEVTVRDEALLARLRESVSKALRGKISARSVPTEDAVLVALAAEGRLRTVLTERERREFADRVAEFVERGGAAVPALRKALREVRAARTAAYSSGG